MVGETLGHYEILAPLGAGGMGEVYRARDTTLKREVAIKVLPADLSADPDRLARLEREAHLLAALNHPNIATIHSLERTDDTRFLVLELVKGESLEERLAKGPLRTEAALDVCKQIAYALEAAHGEGIIHRDLKPANVLITPDGRAKVLDFGLAKAFEAESRDGDISQSPTLTVAGTQAGVIMGTAPYMSPKQVRGLPLDKRVDIWAFGCVLYETLTASRAFARETIADTLAGILETEPNFGALPAATPDAVVALIKRCLRKDPDRRLHDIADARIEIDEALSDPAAAAGPETTAALPRLMAGVVVGALLGAVAVWLALGGLSGSFGSFSAPPGTGTVRAQVVLPDGQAIPEGSPTQHARFSPNGNWIVYDSQGAIYTTAFPAAESQVLVSGSGRCSVVSPAGDRVYFRDGNDVKAVNVDPDTGEDPGTPEVLFTLGEGFVSCGWDVFPDGSGFVTARVVEDPPFVNRFEVIVNWFEELKQRVPSGR